MNPIPESELILNTDGSIYHLNLLPEDIAHTIITVGDQDRIDSVTKHFDAIYLTKQKREFKTVTGRVGLKDLTVISTGIGTDNIDIVFNELDALVNIDFKTRMIKKEHTKLNIIRIGTSGIVRDDIPIGSLLISRYAIGFERILDHYEIVEDESISKVNDYYLIKCSNLLNDHFKDDMFIQGITMTATGFYGPQGRNLRLISNTDDTIKLFKNFTRSNCKVTNLEMETAGIYGLGHLLGHECISLNALLANRNLGTFSESPEKTVQELIKLSLEKIESI